MPQVFNTCFLLGLGVFAAVILVSAWLAVLGVRSHHGKTRKALLLIPVALTLGAVGLYLWLAHQTTPAARFERAFGFRPPPDVTELQAHESVLGDTGRAYLRFRSGPATLQRILPRGFQPGTAPDLRATFPDAPAWWTPPPTPPGEAYHRAVAARGFSTEEEFVILDRQSGEVWFSWLGID